MDDQKISRRIFSHVWDFDSGQAWLVSRAIHEIVSPILPQTQPTPTQLKNTLLPVSLRQPHSWGSPA